MPRGIRTNHMPSHALTSKAHCFIRMLDFPVLCMQGTCLPVTVGWDAFGGAGGVGWTHDVRPHKEGGMGHLFMGIVAG